MKHFRVVLIMLIAIWNIQIYAGSGGMDGFLRSVASADVVGIGVHGGHVGDFITRIDNAIFWLGDPGTNSVLLAIGALDDSFYLDSEGSVGDTVVFWGMRLGWRQSPTNFAFRATPFSAWEWREKLTQTGSAGHIPTPPFQFSGTWINITTNSPTMVNFVSNVVQSLCVSPDLIRYSQSLIPPLDVGWDNELSLFKADAHMEMLKLEWGESEAFLVHVLNDPLQPRKFRGHALFQLQKRFGWSETNTVPEL